MHPFEISIASFFKKQIRQNSETFRVLVGVSGGADSVALLRSLLRITSEIPLELIVATFDHKTRQGDSTKEADWVKQLTKQLQLPFIGGTPRNENTLRAEEEMRDERFRFFVEAAQKKKVSMICLAHHANDQAETVLHHLVRGTGLQGLRGIPETRKISDHLVLAHPMLSIHKREVLEYLKFLNQDFCSDPSNTDPQYTRNRLRHEVMPLLNKINPNASDHLLQLSQQASEVQRYLQRQAEELVSISIISSSNEIVRLKQTELQKNDPVILRDTFRLIWKRNQWPEKKMTIFHWHSLAEFVTEDKKQLELPGQILAQKRGEMLVLERVFRIC